MELSPNPFGKYSKKKLEFKHYKVILNKICKLKINYLKESKTNIRIKEAKE